MRLVFTAATLMAASCVLMAETPSPVLQHRAPVARPAPFLHGPVLQKLLQSSGQIFAGTVLQVEHRNANSSFALATTNIRFRVDEAIRGVRKGQVLDINEWSGLWQSGERYHPGERVLLFLYPPSRLGLTSPVGHGAGRFAVDTSGRVIVKSPAGSRPKPIEIRGIVSAVRRAEQE